MRWTTQVWICACGKTRIDGLGEAFEAIDHCDQDVFQAAVLELGHDAQPEFGTFRLLYPYPQNCLGTVRLDAKRKIHRLAPDSAFVTNFDPQGIEEHQRIH